MRHVVPINGESRTGQISGTGEPHAAPFRKLAEFFIPSGDRNHATNALGQSYGAEPQIIGRHRIGGLHDAQPDLGGVHREFLRNFIELYFLAETRLHGAVTAFWSAGRLVRERAASAKAIARNVVGGSLQSSRVVGTCYAIGAVGAAVDERLEIHCRNRAVFLDASLEFHQNRMTATVTVENLFPRQTDLHRAVQQEGRFRHDNLVLKRIALAAEAAAIRSGNHANVGRRHLQNFCQSAMKVMWRLRARPDRQLSIRILCGDRGMLLNGKMGAAFVEESVLKNLVGFSEALLDVAELKSHALVDVSFLAVLVDARFRSAQRLPRSGDGCQKVILDFNQLRSFEGRQLFARDYGGDRIPDVSYAIHAKGRLVLADGENSVMNWQVLPGQNQINARASQGARGIDFPNQRVRMRRAQQPAIRHSRQRDIIRIARLARHLRAGIHSSPGNAYHAQFVFFRPRIDRRWPGNINLFRHKPSSEPRPEQSYF